MTEEKKNKTDAEINIDISDGDQTTTTESAPEVNPVAETEAEVEPVQPEVEAISLEDDLKSRLAVAEEKLLLAMADFENYKKRQTRRQEDFYRTANDGLLNKLLEVIDNFERAIDHADEKQGDGDLLGGTKMIHKQLLDILDCYQVKPIVVVGQPFDPNLHEALMQVESETEAKGIITMEISKGYLVGERVLRHSKVGVSNGSAKSETDPETKAETDAQADSEKK